MSTTAGRLSPELIRVLADRGDAQQVGRGKILIQEGELSESLFILLTGQLEVFTRDERGRKVIYNTLNAGEVVGEMFLDGGPRSASVQAITPAEVIELRGSEIREFMRCYPELSDTLVVTLSERLRHATTQIRSLALEGVFARTVTAISELAIADSGRRYLPMSITQQQIASRIGATREMVNHVFRELRKGGFLVRDDQGSWRIAKPLPKHQSW